MVDKKHKRHHGAAHGGHPAVEKDESEVRWLISYSDFMMQLVCLFILLYSVSAVDATKASQFAQGRREEIGLAQPVVVTGVQGGAEQLPLTMEQLPEVLKEIEIAAGRYPEGKSMRVSPTAEGFRLQFLHAAFEEGAGQPTKQGVKLLDLAALLLKPYQRRVEIVELVGHASAGDGDREEGSALRLSLTRSREAYTQVTRPGFSNRLEEKRLKTAGRGLHDPVEDNSHAERRAINRRVDFVVRLIPAAKK